MTDEIIKKLEEILRGNPWLVRPRLTDYLEQLKKKQKKNVKIDV